MSTRMRVPPTSAGVCLAHGGDVDAARESRDSAHRHSDAVMALETLLAKPPGSSKTSGIRTGITINSRSVRSSCWPLTRVAKSPPAMAISGVDSVVVGQPEFYREVERLLRTQSLEVWREYLRWTLVNQFASTLSSPFEREHFDSTDGLSGVKEPRPSGSGRWTPRNGPWGYARAALVERYVPHR